jgi:integrase
LTSGHTSHLRHCYRSRSVPGMAASRSTAHVAADSHSANPPKRSPRSPHPGVVLIPPHPTLARRRVWSMRWYDPDTKVRRAQRIPTAHDTVAGQKVALKVAIDKSNAIATRALELQLGAEPELGHTVVSEIAIYLSEARRAVDKHGRLTSPITIARYTVALETFRAWLAAQRIYRLKQIKHTDVSGYRSARIAVRKRDGETRKNSTINQDFKAVGQMLRQAQARGRLTTLTPAQLAGGLERLTEPDPTPRCLTPEEIRATLRAAIAYDDAARLGQARMAPVIALALLGGFRRGELADMQVGHVLLDTTTHGERWDLIDLPKEISKTGKKRDVPATGYSPRLAELLRVLVGDREPDERLLDAEYDAIGCAMAGLIELGAPADLTTKTLRSTCCSYQLPLPGDLKRKAERMGHTLAIAERHYLALPRGIVASAPSLEVAMECDAELATLIDRARTR